MSKFEYQITPLESTTLVPDFNNPAAMGKYIVVQLREYTSNHWLLLSIDILQATPPYQTLGLDWLYYWFPPVNSKSRFC